MISQIPIAALIIVCTQALQDHGIVSPVYFSQHQSSIHQIPSTPALIKTIATPAYFTSLAVNTAAPAYATRYSQPLSYPSQVLSHNGLSSTRYVTPISSVHLPQHALPTIQHASSADNIGLPFVDASRHTHHLHTNSYPTQSLGHIASTPNQRTAVPPLASVISPIRTPVLHSPPPLRTSPTIQAAALAPHYEDYAHPKYEFAYGIEDHHTGDIHSHKEVRDGDVTQGEYSLHEDDGTIRTVKYRVDKYSGFNAIVERLGHATHSQATSVHKVAAATPSPLYH